MEPKQTWWGALRRRILVGGGATGGTLACFLVLPVIQAIAEKGSGTVQLTDADVAQLPQPDPIIEEPEPEPEPEPEEEPPPPDLAEEQAPMDLSQLEAALSGGSGDGWTNSSFALDLGKAAMDMAMESDLFDPIGSDQPPRMRSRVNPTINAKLKKRLKKAEVVVTVIFFVNEDGRVQSPKIERTSDSAFNKSALSAIAKCRFEPGRRGGKVATLPTRQTFRFPKQ